MSYFCKFDETGQRTASIADFQVDSFGGLEKVLAAGYIEVSNEDFNYYAGNRGQGDNGTGYVRGKDGHPVSAPPNPAPPDTFPSAKPVDTDLVALAEAVAAHEEKISNLERSLK